MKTKYAIPTALVDDLILSGMATDEDEAIEKVASGSGLVALRNHKQRQLETLMIEKDHGITHRGASEGSKISELESEIEEINKLIEFRDVSVED